MRRRAVMVAVGGTVGGVIGALLALPTAAQAQPAPKLWRIGILETLPEADNAANLAALRLGLRERGHIEGQHYAFIYRSPKTRVESYAGLAAELVQLKVDLIVTRGTPAAIAAKAATQSIPVVMAAIGDPLMVTASLSRPGGNLTGLTSISTDLEAKRVQILRELVPKARHVAALYDMSNPVFARRWPEVHAAARGLGLQASLIDVRDAAEIEAAFDALKAKRIDALIVGQDGLMRAHSQRIAELAAQRRVPAIYSSVDYVASGGLISYGPNYTDLYQRSASHIDRIIQGAKPGDLPIEQPTAFDLVIHLRAARALNLTLPLALKVRASQLME